MEKISDRAAISRIENAKIPKSGNFITETVAMDYVNLLDKSLEEIIFGDENELEEVLEWFFGRMFRLISLKNLNTGMSTLNWTKIIRAVV